MKELLVEREQTLPRRRDEVFRFFSDPRSLGELTPTWLHFQLVSCSTPSVGEGTQIDYRLRIRGIPIRWRSLIQVWDPPQRFVDEQLIGPYRRWVHEHSFEDLGDRTRVRDTVRYSVLGGALVDRWLVRPDVERIFEYRARRLMVLLGA